MWVLRYVSSTGQLYPFRKATENLFLLFFRVPRQGVTKRKLADALRDLVLPFRKQNISHVAFVCLAVIRLEAPELDLLLLKPAFKTARTTMIAFGSLKTECPHHLMVPRQGNAITEMPASPHCFNLIIDNSS